MEKGRKKSLRRMVLGATLTAVLVGSLIFRNQIDEAIDVAQYRHYLKRSPNLGEKIDQKIFRECAIMNKDGEKILIRPKDMNNGLLWTKKVDYENAVGCARCVEEQLERYSRAYEVWYGRDWSDYKRSQD